MAINSLLTRIRKKQLRLGIIGTGYVGSSIGKSAALQGIDVVGYDPSEATRNKVNSEQIPNFFVSNKFADAMKAEILCICVPTPVTDEKKPDLEPLIDALKQTAKYLRKKQLVIIESTIAPGTTRNIALPLLEQSGMHVEEDFFLTFSPERIDPGNEKYSFSRMPKLVGGIGDKSTYLAYEFYRSFVEHVYLVSSPEVAEMAKMLENSFRLINISFINEISEYTKQLGIDITEVLKAASTKPIGFMPHYPGPGIGGHCIPVDPYYIVNDASERYGVDLSLLRHAGEINEDQPKKVVQESLSIIKQHNGHRKTHKVLLLGVTYKPDIADSRETPALPILLELEKNGIEVSFYDPYVSEFANRSRITLSESQLSQYDLIILLTPHSGIDYEEIVSLDVPFLDTRNIVHSVDRPNLYSLFTTKEALLHTDVKNGKKMKHAYFI